MLSVTSGSLSQKHYLIGGLHADKNVSPNIVILV
jgi:hypothetical protein